MFGGKKRFLHPHVVISVFLISASFLSVQSLAIPEAYYIGKNVDLRVAAGQTSHTERREEPVEIAK